MEYKEKISDISATTTGIANTKKAMDFITMYRDIDNLLDEKTGKKVKKNVIFYGIITILVLFLGVFLIASSLLIPAPIIGRRDFYNNEKINYTIYNQKVGEALKSFNTTFSELEKYGFNKNDYDEEHGVVIKVDKNLNIVGAKKYNAILDSSGFYFFIAMALILLIICFHAFYGRKSYGKAWFSYLKWYRNRSDSNEIFTL